MGRLKAASDSPESIAVKAPWTVGTYYYGACVDAVIGESDTSNNCSDAVRTEVIPIGPPVVTDDGAADRSALVALYNATDGPNWRNNTNWLSTKSLSTWYGVTVSNWEVTGLNLSGNKLSGDHPIRVGQFVQPQRVVASEQSSDRSAPSGVGQSVQPQKAGA